MKKIVLVSLAGITLLAVGCLAGYYYREREELVWLVNASVVDRSLNEARVHFSVLKLLEEGQTVRAANLERSFMLGAFHVASTSASVSENDFLKQQVNDAFQTVVAHYKKYPKRVENDLLWKSMKEPILRGELEIKEQASN